MRGLRLLLIAALVVGGFTIVGVSAVLAQQCADGTAGADNISCTTADPDNWVGMAGDDTMTVTNTGSVGGDINGGPGSDTIINNGTVTGTIWGENNMAAGIDADTITLSGNSSTGAVSTGGGNDDIILSGQATVGGTIDGGAGTDTVTFGYEAPTGDPDNVAGQIATLQGNVGEMANGNLNFTTSMGTAVSLTFSNINTFINNFTFAMAGGGGVITTTTPLGAPTCAIGDGRLNALDCGAPLAVFCSAAGVSVWDLGIDGQGTHAFDISLNQLGQGLANSSLGSGVVIGSGIGNTVHALPGNILLASGPEIIESEKMYGFLFDGMACGVPSGTFTPGEGMVIDGATGIGTLLRLPADGVTDPTVGLNTAPPRPTSSTELVEMLSGYAIVDTDNLFVRSGPNFEYSVVGIVDGGTRVDVLGRNEDGEWWYVQIGMSRGWVNNDFLFIRGDIGELTEVPTLGEITQPRLYVGFDGNALLNAPLASAETTCIVPGGLEHFIIGRTSDATWYQIEANCNGAVVTGWLPAEAGLIRNPALVNIPVTG